MTPSVEAHLRPAALFWTPAILIAAVDVATKYVAHVRFKPAHVPHEVIGNTLRWTLLYNPGAAFGLSLGPYSRWLFLGIAILMLGFIWRVYQATPVTARSRAVGLGLVAGGAMGNLINRLWSVSGVVDFIDVGIGTSRWPAFNVADIGVTIGVAILAVVLRRDESLV